MLRQTKITDSNVLEAERCLPGDSSYNRAAFVECTSENYDSGVFAVFIVAHQKRGDIQAYVAEGWSASGQLY